MIACICHNLNDRSLRQAVNEAAENLDHHGQHHDDHHHEQQLVAEVQEPAPVQAAAAAPNMSPWSLTKKPASNLSRRLDGEYPRHRRELNSTKKQ